MKTPDIFLVSIVHAPEGGAGGGKEKKNFKLGEGRRERGVLEWDERGEYTHSVICMSAKPLSIISPRKMIA